MNFIIKFFWGDCMAAYPTASPHDEENDLFQNLNVKSNYFGVSPSKDYKCITILGNGSMGSIQLARDKRNGQKYAMKSIIMSRITEEFIQELRNEISILKSLFHPNIVKAYETFEDKIGNISILMELCSGGNLRRRQPYSEKAAANIIKKILSAVAYMHSKNIIHRDIKFENIMFESNSPDAEVKLIDFGLSSKYQEEQPYMSGVVGTLTTMAPEVFKKKYTNATDIWSIGVVCYELVSCQKPFISTDMKSIVRKITRGEYSLSGRVWDRKSKEGKDFISKLLIVDPQKRLGAKEAGNEPWFDANFDEQEIPDEDTMAQVLCGLDAYARYGTMKKISLLAMANMSTVSQVEELRKVFTSIDTESDGNLTFSEFKEGMTAFNYSEKEIQTMFRMMDVDEDGKIQYAEFLAATIETTARFSEDMILENFRRFDTNNSGKISKKV